MNIKWLFFFSILNLLLAPASFYASPMPAGPVDGIKTGFYVKLEYNGEYWSNIGKLESLDTYVTPNGYIAYDKAYGIKKNIVIQELDSCEECVESYNPTYAPSWFGGSVAIGYAFDSIRLELEVMYSNIQIDSTGFSDSFVAHIDLDGDITYYTGGAEKWLALAYAPLDASIECFSLWLRNEGFKNIAGILSIYYDPTSSKMPIAPYIGVGGGLTRTTFLGVTKRSFAYQFRGGVSFYLSKEMRFFFGGRYFGISNDKYDGISVTEESGFCDWLPLNYKTEVSNKFGIFGLETGLIFLF